MLAKNEKFSQEQQQRAKVAKLLAHPARIAIIEYLAAQRRCVTGDLSSAIPLSRTSVFQHLEMLKKAGWVKGTICGSKINYCLDTALITEEMGSLASFLTLASTLSSDCSTTC